MEPWQYGVIASGCSALLGTVGVQLRILSVSLEGRKAWALEIVGWTIWLVGQLFGQVAIADAPAVIASCMSFSGALLSNALLAPLILGETLTRKHWSGVVLLITGSAIVLLYSSHASHTYSLETFEKLAYRGPFVVLAAVSYPLLFFIAARTGCQRARLNATSFAFVFALCGATDQIITKFALQVISTWCSSWSTAQPSLAVLVAFSASMIMFHLAVGVCQAFSTAYGDALQNIPLFLGSGSILQVVLGGTFYDEFCGFGLARSLVFGLGIILMLAGLWITSRAAPPDPCEELEHDKETPLLLDEAVLAMLNDVHNALPTVDESYTGHPFKMRMVSFDVLGNMDIERTSMFSKKARQRWHPDDNLLERTSSAPAPLWEKPGASPIASKSHAFNVRSFSAF